YKTCVLNRSFYSHSSSDPRAWNDGMIGCARCFHALVLLRSYWRKWEGFCLRRRPARAHDRRECQSNFILFVEGFSRSSESNWDPRPWASRQGSRPHMQIVCIPMTQKTVSDNGSGPGSAALTPAALIATSQRRGN